MSPHRRCVTQLSPLPPVPPCPATLHNRAPALFRVIDLLYKKLLNRDRQAGLCPTADPGGWDSAPCPKQDKNRGGCGMGSAPSQVLVARSPLSGEDAAAAWLLDPARVPGGRT